MFNQNDLLWDESRKMAINPKTGEVLFSQNEFMLVGIKEQKYACHYDGGITADFSNKHKRNIS